MRSGRKMRIFCLALCIGAAAGYTGTTVTLAARSSSRGPVISMEDTTVCLSVTEGEDGILHGVTATDPEDGDVTGSLVVESISDFLPDGSREAMLAAFDSDGNVSRVVRKLTYEDYSSPRILLKGPLRLRTTETENIRNLVQAQDCLDGNLSEEVKILSEEGMRQYGSGDHTVHLQATNSAGDTTDLPVTVTLYDSGDQRVNTQILLTDYLIYVKKGEQPDWKSYLKGLSQNGKEQDWDSENAPDTDKNSIQIHDPADMETCGVYEVEYSLDSNGYTGNVRLVVVVEE